MGVACTRVSQKLKGLLKKKHIYCKYTETKLIYTTLYYTKPAV